MNNTNYKTKWMDEIFAEYPQLKHDPLKKHFIEQMIDSYLSNEKEFKKMSYEAKKSNEEIFKIAATEVIGISKIDD